MLEQHNSVDVVEHVSDFFFYLEKVTGFSKEAFTRVGLKNRLIIISQRFFKLVICKELIHKVLQIAKILSDTNKTCIEKGEAIVEKFVDVLEKLADFLFTTFLGKCVLVMTASMTNVMAGFIIGLYYLMCYFYDRFSCNWFVQLKNFVMSHVPSEKFLKFFGCIESTTALTI